MIRRLLVCMLIASCGGPDNRLVDQTPKDIEELCVFNSLGTTTCPRPNSCGTFCRFLRPVRPCMELLQSLPDDCEATPDDYLRCRQATCSDSVDPCAAFEACGIDVWEIVCTSCG